MKLVALAAAWVLGLLLGLELDPYPAALVLFSLAALFLILISRMAGYSVWPALLGLVLLMALVRVEISQDLNVLTASDGTGPLVVQGVVSTDPEAFRAGGGDVSVRRGGGRRRGLGGAGRPGPCGCPADRRAGAGQGRAILPLRGQAGAYRKPRGCPLPGQLRLSGLSGRPGYPLHHVFPACPRDGRRPRRPGSASHLRLQA